MPFYYFICNRVIKTIIVKSIYIYTSNRTTLTFQLCSNQRQGSQQQIKKELRHFHLRVSLTQEIFPLSEIFLQKNKNFQQDHTRRRTKGKKDCGANTRPQKKTQFFCKQVRSRSALRANFQITQIIWFRSQKSNQNKLFGTILLFKRY